MKPSQDALREFAQAIRRDPSYDEATHTVCDEATARRVAMRDLQPIVIDVPPGLDTEKASAYLRSMYFDGHPYQVEPKFTAGIVNFPDEPVLPEPVAVITERNLEDMITTSRHGRISVAELEAQGYRVLVVDKPEDPMLAKLRELATAKLSDELPIDGVGMNRAERRAQAAATRRLVKQLKRQAKRLPSKPAVPTHQGPAEDPAKE